MADQTNFERGPVEGPGGGDQLPYGEATQANELAAQAPPPEEAPAPEAPEQPPVEGLPVAGPEEQPPEEQHIPGSTGLDAEDEKYLLSPTEFPDQAPTTMRFIDPADVADWLPDLAQEAARPDASPQLKAIFKAATLGREA